MTVVAHDLMTSKKLSVHSKILPRFSVKSFSSSKIEIRAGVLVSLVVVF